MKIALTTDDPTVTVLDAWAKSPQFSDLEGAVCACGKPVTTVHIRRVGPLPEEIGLYCDECSPVVFVKPYGGFSA